MGCVFSGKGRLFKGVWKHGTAMCHRVKSNWSSAGPGWYLLLSSPFSIWDLFPFISFFFFWLYGAISRRRVSVCACVPRHACSISVCVCVFLPILWFIVCFPIVVANQLTNERNPPSHRAYYTDLYTYQATHTTPTFADLRVFQVFGLFFHISCGASVSVRELVCPPSAGTYL